MSKKLFIPIKETEQELRKLLKKAIPLIAPRIRMLIMMKRIGIEGASKRELILSVGVSGQSIQTWRTTYAKGGIEALLKHGRIGFKPSIFSKAESEKIAELLNDSESNIRGYKELQEWCTKEFKRNFLANSVMKYSINQFGSKIKVARKYHVNKDEEAVSAFKKTSVKLVKKPPKKK